MAKTISTVQLSEYVLTPGANPLSITTAGAVETNGGTAIYGGSSQAWTITNAGTVSGGSPAGSLGIDLRAGGTIGNTGLISGNHYAIRIHGAAGVVTNAGSITSQTDGVVLFAGGSVSNAAGGVIAGTSNVGVYISGGAGTVTNAGTISGAPDAVQFVGAFADQVIIDPGAVFIGKVIGGSGANTLELAQGDGTTGTLTGFGTQFTGFGAITVDSAAAWQLDSTDTIGSAVVLTDAGTLGNAGQIDTTVTVSDGGSLGNTGTINVGSAAYGVTLLAGGVVSNTGAGALIQGYRYGIRADGAAATVTNSGTILGTSTDDGAGVGLYGGGVVTNTGTIIGAGVVRGYFGVYINNGLGVVTNSGTIADGFGVGLYDGGTVSNTGSIYGSNGDGVFLSGGDGTVIDAGTISASRDAVDFVGNYADRVILDPGAVLIGQVQGGVGSNTLELAAGTAGATGTLSGFATSFTGFAAITVDAGAAWYLDATDTIGGGTVLSNAGLLDSTVTLANGGSLDNTGTISVTSAAYGVTLLGGGEVSNTGTGALIEGTRYGIRADSAGAATVTNSGTILGTAPSNGGGVGLYAGGTVTNTGTIISGAYYGVYIINGVGMVTNSGTIISGDGVGLFFGGTVSNTGSINSTISYGVYIRGAAGTLTNAGTIGGAVDAVRFGGSYTDRLILDPGAVLNGQVRGGSGTNTLELAAGTAGAIGTLSSFATEFIGFGTITIDADASWQLDATDTIGSAVELTDSGTLGNAGLIDTTVTVADGGSLDNTGTINVGSAAYGVTLLAGGVVSNTGPGALIQGYRYGIRADGAAATVTNSGTILGTSTDDGAGVGLYGGGVVTNTGTIIGAGVVRGYFGVYINNGLGVVTNSGTIADGFGVGLYDGGTVSNTGSIYGSNGDGVFLSGGDGTVIDAGTISASRDAVDFVGNYADRVILDPGAVLIGQVQGGVGSNTLELAAGTAGAIGTLSSFATEFIGFGTITIDADARWQLDATDTIGSAVVLTDAGTLGNAGLIDTTVTVADGASLDNTGTINAGSAAYGVTLLASGVVSNTGTGALIEGTRYGLRAAGGGTVTNSGTIRGTSTANGGGVALYGGGVVTNTGTIMGAATAGFFGVYINNGLGTVINSGTITDGYGVGLGDGGTVSNTGSIDGSTEDGVFISGAAGTVIDAGTISGAVDAIRFAGNFADRLILDPGAVLNGQVQGGSGSNTLELAAGTTGATGTLSGLATSFTGFGAITVDAGAAWYLDATDTIGGGTVLSNAGLVDSTVTLGNGGSLHNTGTVNPGSAVYGVTLLASGVVSNTGTGALIEGTRYGLRAAGGGTVTNSGTIRGTSTANGGGVALYGGGVVTNTGTITGAATAGFFGVYINNGRGTVTNGGTITGSYGVGLGDGGTVRNTGSIDGSTGDGVFISGAAGTVTNAGIISGGLYAVRFSGAFADRMIVDPGAVFLGKVAGGSGTNTLELASGAATGTLSGFGTSFTGFGTITIDANASWSFDSTDTIGAGVSLIDAGTLTNRGMIQTEVYVSTTAASFSNYSTVSASGEAAVAARGAVINHAGGTLEGATYGVVSRIAGVGVSNAGAINGSSIGVDLGFGGSVTNAAGGSIGSPGFFGVYIRQEAGTVTNAGSITGHTVGVGLIDGGSVSNAAGGTITGTTKIGVAVYGAGGTVTNAGTISGVFNAVQFFGAYTDRVIVDPGAVFIHNVAGGSGTNTLELASGASTGTLSGFGTSFTGFGALTIDAGASWRFDATDTLGAGISLANTGTLLFSQAAGSSLNVAATISGPGEVEQSGAGTLVLDGIDSFTGGLIIAGGTLELSAGNAAGSGPITFAGDPTLRLDGTVMPTGTISGLAIGDVIDLAGVTYASGGSATIINSNTLQVIENSATYDLTLDPLQNFRHLAFTPTKDAGTGTLITVDAACYCRGTRILTTRGEVAVEDLCIGDHLVTLSGAARPVRWIGRRHLDLTRHPTPDRVRPIRIRANAFADTVPHRDLLVSPDHAVLCEDVLVPARLLVNGASIVRDTQHRAVTYFHVELDTHDIMLAENLPAESYLDTGNRFLFENADAAQTLHPDLTNDQARRVAESCAPFADDPVRTEPIWRALAARAVQLGWDLPPGPETTDDPALRLLVDGRQVAPVGTAHGRHVFLVPRADAAVRLVSRAAVPSEASPWVADDRCLGVLLRGLRVWIGATVVPIPLDHPDLTEGWWQPEWHGPTALRRWTDGDAVVPMPDAALARPGPCLLEVEVAAAMRYTLPTSAPRALDARTMAPAMQGRIRQTG